MIKQNIFKNWNVGRGIIMIQSIYETHLHVRNLEKAIDFYQNKLGLILAKTIEKAGCFLMGRRK